MTAEQSQVSRVVRYGRSLYAVIPAPLVRRLGWKRRDLLVAAEVDGVLILTRLSLAELRQRVMTGAAGTARAEVGG